MAASVMAGSGRALVSFAERLIGGDQHRAPLGLGLVHCDVGKIIEDQEIEAIKALMAPRG
ncbi:hypothetical protein GGD67_002762 [Bradyrhizobium sp. IAR9]|nr:hypothetical protein [Bradyrhizobium sp. IAR9]